MFVSQSDYHQHFSKKPRGRKSDIPWDDLGEGTNDWYWFIPNSDRTETQIKRDDRPGIPKRFKKTTKKFRTEKIKDNRINMEGIMIVREE